MLDYKKIVGKKIKEIRKKLGMTQAQLAEKLDVEYKYVSRLETGTSSPSFTMLEKLAVTLNVELTELFVKEDDYARENILKKINGQLNKANLEVLNVISRLIDGVLG